MKKTLYAFSALCCMTVLAVSCKKSHPVDCTSSSQKVSNAASAYITDQSSANCKAYKSALQDYVNSSCLNSLTAQQKAEYQDEVNSLTCP